MNCSKINAQVYGEEGNRDALEIVKMDMVFFNDAAGGYYRFIDTSGDTKRNKDCLREMRTMYSMVTPDQVFLVIDGTIGQQAYRSGKDLTRMQKSVALLLQNWMA